MTDSIQVPVFINPNRTRVGTANIQKDGKIIIDVGETLGEQLWSLHVVGFSKGLRLNIIAEPAIPLNDST